MIDFSGSLLLILLLFFSSGRTIVGWRITARSTLGLRDFNPISQRHSLGLQCAAKDAAESEPVVRRTHKNKYAQFSKKIKDPATTNNKLTEILPRPEEKALNSSDPPTLTSPFLLKLVKTRQKHSSNNITNQTFLDKDLNDHPSTSAEVDSNNAAVDPHDPTFGFAEIGVILGAHGVHGEIKVHFDSDFAEQRVAPGALLHIKKPLDSSPPRPVRVAAGRQKMDKLFLVKLEEISSRSEADLLKKYKVYVKADDRPPLQENEFLARDLVGLQCFLQSDSNGKALGVVEAAIPPNELFEGSIAGKMHSMLEIRKAKSQETVLVPFVPAIVVDVDLARNRIYLDPPAGLFDKV